MQDCVSVGRYCSTVYTRQSGSRLNFGFAPYWPNVCRNRLTHNVASSEVTRQKTASRFVPANNYTLMFHRAIYKMNAPPLVVQPAREPTPDNEKKNAEQMSQNGQKLVEIGYTHIQSHAPEVRSRRGTSASNLDELFDRFGSFFRHFFLHYRVCASCGQEEAEVDWDKPRGSGTSKLVTRGIGKESAPDCAIGVPLARIARTGTSLVRSC